MTEWDYIEMPTSLMQTIEQKRSELVSFAIKYGLSSEKTIKSSQELDKLLNTLEKSKSFH
ncbi:aspartyl-phosphate phosphatase Spo0E family protein [Alkalihalobacillus sp. BA299]|uniref:aspartyl-phosphate phosphatase Spo0E family protein n=1 Tax=Alkalihalobacillus sp. BA299 TaxID=2815938 RepID=UPI001FFDFB2E|nr:aspartyl-phosphate phosphatase Spo0E family protein [Alkalihalobacillus sp. BA299]